MESFNELKVYYQQRIALHQKSVVVLQNKIIQIVIARLVVFTAIPASIYFLWNIAFAVFITPLIGAIIFMYLLKTHGKLSFQKSYTDALVKVNQQELNALNNDFSIADDGSKYIDGNHFFSHDIDLFGKGSFFQLINRTHTEGGGEALQKALTSNSIDHISKKQLALKELASKYEFRESFRALALSRTKTIGADLISNWFAQFTPVVPSIFKWIGMLFSAISIMLIVLLSIEFITAQFLIFWMLFGLLLTGIYFKKIINFGIKISTVVESIRINEKLLELIEKETFHSELLLDLKANVTNKNSNVTASFRALRSAMDLFNNRNNLLVIIGGNGLFLWDLQTMCRLQKWILQHKNDIGKWTDTIYQFDAQISLSNYVFNNPDYVFPTICEEVSFIKAQKLGHPLISKDKCILNDVSLKKEQFFIITGANMAGKSTFLRTVALSIIMTNTGLPVFAKNFEYSPMKLITSMRSTDSLKDDESYFFSELKRLKFIVNQLQNQPYFIILDEILKGTNSKDKEEGSKKFVQRLVSMNATGIIATHDLGLCTIEDQLPQIANFYFDAEIVNDELYFDYTMKKGVCKNMNASFLLRKMGIVEN